MKVLLVSVNRERINMAAFPLGMSCVAEAARAAGHDVRELDFFPEKDPEAALKDVIGSFSPEVIGVSLRNIDDQCMASANMLIDQAKEAVLDCRRSSRAPVVLGGAGYSIFPESALEYCCADFGISGEGEVAFPMLLHALEHGGSVTGVPGLFTKHGGASEKMRFAKDLDALPLPGYAMWKSMADKPGVWLPIQSRRGCAMNCSYCSTASIEGLATRMRSPEKVIENLRAGVDSGFRDFYFTDNTFNLPQRYAKDLCAEIIRSGLDMNWRCIIYPTHADDELAELMFRAGCREISLGFESGCEHILKGMNKKFLPGDIKETNRIFAAHGVMQTGFLMLGGPGETRQTAVESVAFAESLDLTMLKITTGIRIYPNTLLAEKAVDEGMIEMDDNLLFPRFYIEDALKEWLPEQADKWVREKKNWIR